jgi:hypothetical protein
MLLGLIHPTAGQIEIWGEPLTPSHNRVRRLCQVFQVFHPTQKARQAFNQPGRRWKPARRLSNGHPHQALNQPVLLQTFTIGHQQAMPRVGVRLIPKSIKLFQYPFLDHVTVPLRCAEAVDTEPIRM